MAFSATHMNGAEPTDSTLDDFERKDLASYKSKANANSTARLQRSINEFNEIGSDEEDNDVMGAYICTTPKVRQTNSNGFLCEYYCFFFWTCLQAQKPVRSRGISTPVSNIRNTQGSMDSPM